MTATGGAGSAGLVAAVMSIVYVLACRPSAEVAVTAATPGTAGGGTMGTRPLSAAVAVISGVPAAVMVYDVVPGSKPGTVVPLRPDGPGTLEP